MSLNETIADNVRKIHDLERDNSSLKLSFEEVQHNCKRDVANLKLEMVKEKGEHNRAKEALNTQISGLSFLFCLGFTSVLGYIVLKISISNNTNFNE
jgi:hypothetical protein